MSRNREDAIDRLGHCADKVASLAAMNFRDFSKRGEQGFRFLLRDLSEELGDIFEELFDELQRREND